MTCKIESEGIVVDHVGKCSNVPSGVVTVEEEECWLLVLALI